MMFLENKYSKSPKSFRQQLKDKEVSHERFGRIVAGVSIIVFLLLAVTVHIYFLFGLVGIGINLIQSGISNNCLVKEILIKMGFPGEADLSMKNQIDPTGHQLVLKKIVTNKELLGKVY